MMVTEKFVKNGYLQCVDYYELNKNEWIDEALN
jgi:hypothetical protein